MGMTAFNTIRGSTKPLATVNSGTIDHTHLIEQPCPKKTAVDVAATYHTDPLASELTLQDTKCAVQIYALFTRDDIGDTPPTQIVNIFARSLLAHYAEIGRILATKNGLYLVRALYI